jgi:hypothetical protein
MDYDNWSRCSAKSVFQAHGIDGARKDEHSPPAQAPLCIGVLLETAGVPGWHVWVAGGGARHIGDNQGAVSRCKAIPKLRPEPLDHARPAEQVHDALRYEQRGWIRSTSRSSRSSSSKTPR